MKVIPAIDLRDGEVVRLRQGDFAQTRRFDVDPAALARRYADAGADWLHAVDLDGAQAGEPIQLDALAALSEIGLDVQWGGGVRTRADIETLFAAGAARVVIGSVAVFAPGRCCEWLRLYGGERLCLAMDVRQSADGVWQPAVSAWREQADVDMEVMLDAFVASGLTHVLCTDIDRDGMAQGPNLGLYTWLAARWPQFRWIASGGVRDRTDVAALACTGVAACVAGTSLLDGSLPLSALAGSTVE